MGSDGWDSIPNEMSAQSGGDGNIFFIPQKGENKIRLIKQPARFLCHWNIGAGKEVCWKTQGEDVDCPLCNVAGSPSERYIICVLDRNDVDANGVSKLKVYEGGRSVFPLFKKYKDATGIDPGGKSGPDWLLTKEVADTNNPRFSTSYSCIPLPATDLTEDEIAMLKIELPKIKLENFFKCKSADELADVLRNYQPEDDSSNNSKANTNSGSNTAVEASASSSSVDVSGLDMEDIDDEDSLDLDSLDGLISESKTDFE